MILIFLLTISTVLSLSCDHYKPLLIIDPPSDKPPSYFCIQQATALRPSSMIALDNCSCLLFEACKESSLDAPSLPLYQKSKLVFIPLLITRADRNEDPYEVMKNPKIRNESQMMRGDVGKVNYLYKSPLITETYMFEGVFLQMSGNSGKTLAYQEFKLASGKSVADGSWFSIEGLIKAGGIDKDYLIGKGAKLVLHKESSVGVRSFIIHRQDVGGCNDMKDFTYLMVLSNSKCPLAEGKRVVYLFSQLVAGIPKTYFAEEIRIYGKLRNNSVLYEMT